MPLNRCMAHSGVLRSGLGDKGAGGQRTRCPATGAHREGHADVEAGHVGTFTCGAQVGTIEPALEGWLSDGVHPRTAECCGKIFVVAERVKVRC